MSCKPKLLLILSLVSAACGQSKDTKMQGIESSSARNSGALALTAQQQACADVFVAEFNSFQTAALTLSQSLSAIDIQSLSQSQNTIENAKKGFALADTVNPQITDAPSSSNLLSCSPIMNIYINNLKQNLEIAHANAVQAQQSFQVMNQATATASVEVLKPKLKLASFGLADSSGSITDAVTAESLLGQLPVDHALAIVRSGNALFTTIMAEHMATRIAEASAVTKLVDRVARPYARQSMANLSGSDFQAEIQSLKAKLTAAMRLEIALPPAASVGLMPGNAEESAAVDKTFQDIIQVMAIVQANTVMSAHQLTVLLQSTANQKVSRDLARRILSSTFTKAAGPLPLAAPAAVEPVLASVALVSLRGLTGHTLDLLNYSSAMDSRASLMLISLAKGILSGVTVSSLPVVALPDLPTDAAISNESYLNLLSLQLIALQNAAVAQQQNVAAGREATAAAVAAILK